MRLSVWGGWGTKTRLLRVLTSSGAWHTPSQGEALGGQVQDRLRNVPILMLPGTGAGLGANSAASRIKHRESSPAKSFRSAPQIRSGLCRIAEVLFARVNSHWSQFCCANTLHAREGREEEEQNPSFSTSHLSG